MTREKLHSALELLDQARRLLGGSTIHADIFDVDADVVATILLEGGSVVSKPHWTTGQIERPGVNLDVYGAGNVIEERPGFGRFIEEEQDC